MNKSSSLFLHLHLLHLLIMNKSSYFKKKKKEIFEKGLGTKGIGLVLLRLLSKKKKIISQNFQFLEKIQDFQIFQKKKKNFIKFFFKNGKLWSSSIFSSGATSSQLSTLSIHRSMEYVLNEGHLPGMSNSFQWITPLLIENVYFAGTSVKAHTHWCEPKPKKPWYFENMSQDPKILDLWKHEPGSRTFGPLKTWAKTPKS